MNDYYDRLEAQLAGLTERGAHRRWLARHPLVRPISADSIALGVAALLVVGIGAIFLSVRTQPRPAARTQHVGTNGLPPAIVHNFSPTTMPALLGNIVCRPDLQPPSGRRSPSGAARIYEYHGGFRLWIRASGLKPNARHDAYAVWLDGGPKGPRLVGVIRPSVGPDGQLAAEAPLPAGAARYFLLLITRETGAPTARPGPTVLEGFMAF